MSFLLQVASQARAVPDIPVARPNGLLPGLSPAPPPIEQVQPAPAPIQDLPARSPPPSAALEVVSPPPAAPSAPSPAAPPAAAAPKILRDEAPVVERPAPPPVPVEASGPAEPSPEAPDAARPASSAPADAEPPSDPPDLPPPSRPILTEPRHDVPQAGPLPEPSREGPVGLPATATRTPGDAPITPREAMGRREGALGVAPPRRGEGAPLVAPEAPAPADRPIGERQHRAIEVLPIAQPLMGPPTSSLRLPPAERALPARPAPEAKPPLLQIDQIDVVVTDPAPVPMPARSAPSASRRYLRRL